MKGRKKPTQLSDIGEFGLIDRLTQDIILKHKSSLKGVGDDAAVIDCGNTCRVLTTDMLTEGIHFDLMYTPLKHLGYKAVIVNLSDVYAMNAIPQQITVSIGISSKFSVEAIEELYSGIHLACEQYNVDLVGGDTVSSLSGLIISVTAIGEAKKEEIKYRSGAQSNDLICVTGDLGGAFLGLQLLEREKAIYEKDNAIQPDLTGFDYILERQLKPEARGDIIEWFREENIQVHAMIDISDGLSSEINHICKNSNKGCHIYPDKLPVNKDVKEAAKQFNMEYLVPVLHGGEDYELLFTVPLSEFDKISKRDDVHIIGNITKEGEKPMLITDDGKAAELVAQGWEGF
jgi:thiamine-monophosphate kinase